MPWRLIKNAERFGNICHFCFSLYSINYTVYTYDGNSEGQIQSLNFRHFQNSAEKFEFSFFLLRSTEQFYNWILCKKKLNGGLKIWNSNFIMKSDWLKGINFIGLRAPSRQHYFETMPELCYWYISNLKAGVFLTFVYHWNPFHISGT